MIMPSKIIKPVDSLFSISAFILKILKSSDMTVDGLHEKLNESYYKEVTQEKLILSINFLFILDKVEMKDEAIKIKVR